MASNIVGSIRPGIELTETEAFDAPTRIVNVTDASGRLHGRIQWLADEVNEGFERGLLHLYIESTGEASTVIRSPSAAS